MRSCVCTIAIGTMCISLMWVGRGNAAAPEPRGKPGPAPANAATGAPQKTDPPAKADPLEVTVTLRNGTALACRLLTDVVPVETSYGILKVPARDVLVIYQGIRAEKTDAASATPGSEPDIVVAKGFTIPGRVALDAYEVESPLGNTKIEPGKIESLSCRPWNVPTVTLPASLNTTGDPAEVKNWRYRASEEAGWTHPSFDETKWEVAPSAAISTIASGIPRILVSAYQPGTQYCFRRCFLLNSQPKTASLDIRAQSYEARVNGINVGTGGVRDISGMLRRGLNVVTVKATLLPDSSGGTLQVKLTAQ
jgi:hypothetical protein